ncbi:MAG: YfcE family phosphodiesterase [Halobacteriaceae archaeon]
MVEIAVVGDTHIPSRASTIPDKFKSRIEEADITIHTGDFTSQSAYDQIEDLADRFIAVYGNMDPRNLDLAAVETVTVEDQTFVVTHGTGDLEQYEERVASIVSDEASDEAIGIAGHTHEVMDTQVESIRLLNPGSLTGADPADKSTMMILTVEEGSVDVEVLE